MPRLDLNVAGRPFVETRTLERALLVASVLLALVTFLNGYRLFAALHQVRGSSQALKAMQAEAEQARAETKDLLKGFNDGERKRLRQVAVSTSGIIRKRKLSWTRLLGQLEAVLPRDVRILAISPDPQGRQMVLLMECLAKDNEAKLKLYGKLHETPFSEAYILGESLDQDRIRFSIRCRYDPEGGDALPIEEPMPWQLKRSASVLEAGADAALASVAGAFAVPTPAKCRFCGTLPGASTEDPQHRVGTLVLAGERGR